MKLFDSELMYLSELYDRLSHELSGLKPDSKPEEITSAVDCVLRNQELFARLEKMNTRLYQLAKEWEQINPCLDPRTKKHVQELAAKAREKALTLSRLNEEQLTEIEICRTKLGRELDKNSRGSQYLASVKPLKQNYPKFIDSRG